MMAAMALKRLHCVGLKRILFAVWKVAGPNHLMGLDPKLGLLETHGPLSPSLQKTNLWSVKDFFFIHLFIGEPQDKTLVFSFIL